MTAKLLKAVSREPQAVSHMPGARLEKVGPDNLARCGIGCLTNPKNVGFRPKFEWLQARFAEGLRMLLFRDDQGHPPYALT